MKLNGDEQQDATNHLKEYCDIDDIEPQWKDNAVCKICNEPFVSKNSWNNIFRKSKLSCCELIVAKYLNKEKSNQSYG